MFHRQPNQGRNGVSLEGNNTASNELNNHTQEKGDRQKIGWLTNQTAQILALLGSAAYIISSFAIDDATGLYFNRIGAVLCFAAAFVLFFGQQGLQKYLIRRQQFFAIASFFIGSALFGLSSYYYEKTRVIWADRTLPQLFDVFGSMFFFIGLLHNSDNTSISKFVAKYILAKHEQDLTTQDWLNVTTAVMQLVVGFASLIVRVFMWHIEPSVALTTTIVIYCLILLILSFWSISIDIQRRKLKSKQVKAQLLELSHLLSNTPTPQLNYYKHSEFMRKEVLDLRQEYPNAVTHLAGLREGQLAYLYSVLELPIPDVYVGEERALIATATQQLTTLAMYELLDIWAGIRRGAVSSSEQWFATTEYTDDEQGRIAAWMEDKLQNLFPSLS